MYVYSIHICDYPHTLCKFYPTHLQQSSSNFSVDIPDALSVSNGNEILVQDRRYWAFHVLNFISEGLIHAFL